MSIKNTSGTIGNQTRNLQACSAVPQETVPHMMGEDRYKPA